jgi:hypothetical protein
MIISKVSFTRKWNLGNFESLDLSIEAQIGEKDNPLETWTILKDNAEMWFIDYKKKLMGGNEGKQPFPSVSPTSPKPSATPPTQQRRSINDIAHSFPEIIEAKLTFEQRIDYIIIKPKYFLGTEMFAQISGMICSMGGEYISAGKDSHWRIKQ